VTKGFFPCCPSRFSRRGIVTRAPHRGFWTFVRFGRAQLGLPHSPALYCFFGAGRKVFPPPEMFFQPCFGVSSVSASFPPLQYKPGGAMAGVLPRNPGPFIRSRSVPLHPRHGPWTRVCLPPFPNKIQVVSYSVNFA